MSLGNCKIASIRLYYVSLENNSRSTKSNIYMYKYTQSIYKILQEKYKKINSEHIYSERIQDLYRIALEERNTKSLLKIAEILAIS